jgi:flagellin
MSLFSVNTNVGAANALRHLGATTADLGVTQRRVAAGRRVSSVRDSGATWVVAQQQRAAAGAMDVLKGGLQRAQSAIGAAIAGGESVSDLLSQMREKALAASETAMDADSRASLNRDFEQLRDQITRVIDAAGFDGLNLINATAVDRSFQVGLAVGPDVQEFVRFRGGNGPRAAEPIYRTVSGGVSSLTVESEPLNLGGGTVTVTTTDALTDAAASKLVAEQVRISALNTAAALARLGSSFRQMQRQEAFLGELQKGLLAGVGDLVDADLGRESARLEALQMRERLGTQALGIANAQPRMLLSLFR